MSAPSESQIINALWAADRKGYSRPLRLAVEAARDFGLSDEQIAAELKTTSDKIGDIMNTPPSASPGAPAPPWQHRESRKRHE
jgi:hypothetical protein